MSDAAPGRGVEWERLAARLDRLNRVLIPKTRADRERFERSRSARLIRRLAVATERLSPEGQALAIVSGLSWLAALDVRGSETYLAWAAVVAVLGASLALSPLVALGPARLEVRAPRRVTVGEEACLSVTVHNDGAQALSALVVRGAWTAWERVWVRRSASIASVAPRGRATVELLARFASRGAHTLEPVSARARVPLGFALGPRVVGAPLRVLAVPRIAKLSSLALPRAIRHRGGRARPSRGADARELAGLRPYRPGDPVRDLHARTWARIGEPVVREYQELLRSHVGIVLDTTPSEPRSFEAAVSLTAGVVARALGAETLIEALVLGSRVHGAGRGQRLTTLEAALDLLATVELEAAFEPELVSRRLGPELPRLTALVFVTAAWDDARRAWVAQLASTGVPTLTLVVGDGADEAGVRHVGRGRIERGEELWL